MGDNFYECDDCPLVFREHRDLLAHSEAHHPSRARLQDALDAERARADSYLDLIHQAISHHIKEHPECGHYRTEQT